MFISSNIFEAYLHCSTKCWLVSHGEVGSNNVYAEWIKDKNEVYRVKGTLRISSDLQADEYNAVPSENLNVKAALWKFASDVAVSSNELESCIHAIERLSLENNSKSVQFVPIRFVASNKLSKPEKLLIAFDMYILSEKLKGEVTFGKIIHGAGYSTLKVKSSPLVGEVKKIAAQISSLLASKLPPDLILNHHCPVCEYQKRCREKAIEKDDLSLLSGMGENERKKLNDKGIFTVTQLSFTFRPRRKPKRQLDKHEKYHHALKALAIRENKIHIVGIPELKIIGTPVYLDVESLPDREFYYLIGVRFWNGNSIEQHSLWADSQKDEEKIWIKLLKLLRSIQLPVLFCYGSYEMTFIKEMCNRYGKPNKRTKIENIFSSVVNIVSIIYGRVYFPVISNGLKEIAGYCGFHWTELEASGIKSIVWREQWETSGNLSEKEKLLRYNAEDCEALECVTQKLLTLQNSHQISDELTCETTVDISTHKRENVYGFKKNTFLVAGFEEINQAAYWDYQRERVYVKSKNCLKRKHVRVKSSREMPRPNKIIICSPPKSCHNCRSKRLVPFGNPSRIIIDLKFSPYSIKRWITQYKYRYYRCLECGKTFNREHGLATGSKHGDDLIAFTVYQFIELNLPIGAIERSYNKLFGLNLGDKSIHIFKTYASNKYASTYYKLIHTICNGRLIHADETKMSLRDRSCYVWVLTSMEEVVYIYTETRESDYIKTLLKNFKGVLVSDFYAGYDGIDCQQQKCLIHLIRDFNNELYKHPYDNYLKQLADAFAKLLRPMIETVDSYGLKKYHLNKHISSVDEYYKKLSHLEIKSEIANTLKKHLEKNRNFLFTFLQYDDVPWNNNNAEHAVKAFVMLRHIIKGVTNEKGLKEYLILLSVCETCKYKGVDFLAFLRSGEIDIDIFAVSHRKQADAKAKPSTKNTKKLPLNY